MKHALASVIAAATLAAAAHANAATCTGRPTDSGGFRGYDYGDAEVKTFDGTRVRVHYATIGTHAPDLASTRGDDVPDSVAVAVEAGDTALTKYAAMGFKKPPSDASCASNGGNDKVDVYLIKFSGADGQTVRDACDGSTCSSFVLVESTFSFSSYATAAEGFRTVVSHELFHAVQNAYPAETEGYWAEGTAQWAMHSVYPDLLDFQRQMPPFFADNTRSLDSPPSGVTAGFLYGSSVWPLFLTLRHGPDTVRSIFEQMSSTTKAIAATEAVLTAAGSSLAEDMPLFGAWNTATNSLAGEGGYPDAAKYPGIETLPLADGVSAITSGLPYFVYRGTLESASKISLETEPTRNAGVVVPFEGGKPVLAKAKPLPANAEGEVMVVIAGITAKKTDAPFTVHIGAPDATLPGSESPSTAPDGSAAQATANDSSSSGGCAIVIGTPSSDVGSSFVVLALLGVLGRRRKALPPWQL